MSTLYIDIDDTLIKWHDGPGFVTEWDPNPKVFDAIRRHAHEFDVVIIWSTGGGDYAWKMWHHPRLTGMVENLVFGCESKWPRIPGPGDVFIDDDPLSSFASATIHPKDLL